MNKAAMFARVVALGLLTGGAAAVTMTSAQAARNAVFWDAKAQPGVAEESDDDDSSRAATTPADAHAESVRKRSRILFALLALAGVLWPVLNELLRALISFLYGK